MPHTIIVVPCFNEELRLQVEQFRDFAAANRMVHFVMVNDGSQDGTLEILTQLKAEQPDSFEILDLQHNVGKAEAVRRGCCLALKRHPELVGYWDADLAAPLDAVLQFRNVLQRCPQVQMVIGSRMSLLGHAVSRSRFRYCLGRLFSYAASLVLGLRIHDTQAGHKLFRVSDRLSSVFSERFLARWIFDVEILARWMGRRCRSNVEQARQSIYEFPLETWNDVSGSKLRSADFVQAARDLVVIAWTSLPRMSYNRFRSGVELQNMSPHTGVTHTVLHDSMDNRGLHSAVPGIAFHGDK